MGAGVCWGGGGRARSVRLSAALDGGLARPDALVRCMAAVQGLERHPSQNGEKVWSSSGAVGSNSGHHPAKDLNLLSRFHALGSPPRALREAFPSLCSSPAVCPTTQLPFALSPPPLPSPPRPSPPTPATPATPAPSAPPAPPVLLGSLDAVVVCIVLSLTCSRTCGPPVFVTPLPPQRISRTTTPRSLLRRRLRAHVELCSIGS